MGDFAWPANVVPVSRRGPDTPFAPQPADILERSLSARFEEMVALYPDRPLVITPDASLTYAALNRRANNIARAILDRLSDVPAPVALLFETDTLMLATLYGALKAAKTYIPLDVSYPRERLSYMLGDCGAPLVVTDAPRAALARELATDSVDILDVDTIDLDADCPNPDVPVSLDAATWIIYTSGSTGRPKGVAESRLASLHNCTNEIQTLHISRDDRITMLESFGFSGTLLPIFCSSFTGASMLLYDVKKRGTAGLLPWLAAEKATILSTVPALFRHIAGALDRPGGLPSVRVVKTGGDRVTAGDIDLYRSLFDDGCVFANGYGTTEGGFHSVCFVHKDTPGGTGIVPLGYAVDGMEMLIIDGQGRELPPGETGEVAVRSRYLGIGYWRRPEFTANRFLPGPPGSHKRIYRTGDLGRLLGDGCLLGLGRIDFQAKVRGFRIETAEVENTLAEIPPVREAVVVTRPDSAGEDMLVAYFVADGDPPTATTLRRELLRRLPDYMVPSVFVPLDSLPVSPHGKVDRRALPDPPRSRPSLDVAFVPAATPIETRIAKMWAELLGLDQVGVEDDFLDLGGHSLLAARLLVRLNDAFGLGLPTEALIEAPTVARTAVLVAESLASLAGDPELADLLLDLENTSD